jgi:uncharacterized protein YaaQ
MISLMGIDRKDINDASIIEHNCKVQTQGVQRGRDEVSDVVPPRAARRELDRIQYISAVRSQWARCELERLPRCLLTMESPREPDLMWSRHGMISLMGIDRKDIYDASIIEHNCKVQTQGVQRGRDEVPDVTTRAAGREMDRIQYISAVRSQWARCELERLLRCLLAMESPLL